MIFNEKLVICAVASIIAHVAIARGLELIPKDKDRPLPPRKIEIRVVAPEPPPPEPPKPPEPVPPPPKPEVHDLPPPKPVHAPTVAAVAKDVPPPDHPAVTTDTTDTPVYGITMESTSAVGGPAVPVGNTTKAPPGPGAPVPAAQKRLSAPVAAYEATKMPLPQGRCSGKFTEEATAAGTEGKVVLDLIVGEDGRARDIVVVEGLPHGLSEAAVTALKECKFTPGEKDGKPVAVRIRGFKVSFYVAEPN